MEYALTHEEAVKISNSGQGAVVSELIRLSTELELCKKRIERLNEIINELEDRPGRPLIK